MTARSPAELIALRAVLGLGAALVMPATLSTITGTFTSEQRTRAVSVWAAVAGGAAVLGLLVSGLALEVWSWPSVFGLNVVLAAVAIAGTLRFVPESADRQSLAPGPQRCPAGRGRPGRTGVLHHRSARPGVAVRPHIGRPGRWPGGPDRLHRMGAAPPGPDDRPPGFHQPGPGRGQPVDLRAVLRPVRLYLHRPAVPAAHPGRLGPGLGAQHAAHGRRHAARHPAGPGAGRPARAPGRPAPPGWSSSPRP